MRAQFVTGIVRALSSRSGATSIEYAMIAGFVSISIVAVISGMGSNLKTLFYDKLLALF
jgi:Flp pilus assembly pilin Flp